MLYRRHRVASTAVAALAALILGAAPARADHRSPRSHVGASLWWSAWGPGYWGPGYWGAGYWGPWPLYATAGPWITAPPPRAEVRFQVKPSQTLVYVDGYETGSVDDYDGLFQRLSLEPGRHEIALYLAGYQTARKKILVSAGSTLKIRHEMQPLAPGEPQGAKPRPEAASTPPDGHQVAPRPREPGVPAQPAIPARYGALALSVQPAGAELWIDGERWSEPLEGPTTLQLPVGEHRLELRMGGRTAYAVRIAVRAGETLPLNVKLALGGER